MGLAYVRHASTDRLKRCNSVLRLLEDMMKKQAYRQTARGDGTAKEGKTKCTTDWEKGIRGTSYVHAACFYSQRATTSKQCIGRRVLRRSLSILALFRSLKHLSKCRLLAGSLFWASAVKGWW